MAAVAGHVDHLVPVRDLAERVHVRELDPVVEPVPQTRQKLQGHGDEAMRVVGGDLIDAASRLQQRVAPRRSSFLAHALGHRLAHRA